MSSDSKQLLGTIIVVMLVAYGLKELTGEASTDSLRPATEKDSEGAAAAKASMQTKSAVAEEASSAKAPTHIKRSRAIGMCEDYAESQVAFPSTVEFSDFLHLDVQEFSNGRTRVNSMFTAKNAFNLELQFEISCLFDQSGLIEAMIQEAR